MAFVFLPLLDIEQCVNIPLFSKEENGFLL